MREVLEVNSPGLLTSIQDGGRPGWRRFGIPPGGAMDRGAWHTANRMLHNALDCPALECLQGASLRVLEETAVATSGAWGALAWTARPGEIIEFPPSLAGVWHYLALPGGIEAAHFLDSASVCARAQIGTTLAKGSRIACLGNPAAALPAGVKCRHPVQLEDYSDAVDAMRVWPGPQWQAFDEAARRAFFGQVWHVSSRSDRTGYRLEGAPIAPPPDELVSEPVRVGSVQVPPNGQPVVTLHDGPTVGGYAKIALIDPADLDRLAQTRPGQSVRFTKMPGW